MNSYVATSATYNWFGHWMDRVSSDFQVDPIDVLLGHVWAEIIVASTKATYANVRHVVQLCGAPTATYLGVKFNIPHAYMRSLIL